MCYNTLCDKFKLSKVKPMKILITTDLYCTSTNGVATSVRNLKSELEARGHDVRILTLSDSVRSHKADGVYYIRSLPVGVIYPNVRAAVSFRHRYIRELVDWKPDVIHSQCEFFSFQFAKHISSATGAPIVHTYHTLYEQYVSYLFPSRRLGRFVVRLASRRRLRCVKRVVAPTRKVEDALHGYGLRKPISIVPSGISLEQHSRRLSPEERLEKRRELGIADDDFVLINLGRLGTEKNLDELLEFFAQACKVRSGVKFLIVGGGPAKEELEARARSLGIEQDVIFTGMVPPDSVQTYYQLGDVFVSASTSETQGLTYVEAAANGLPLLCRRDPCLDDVIKPGENGFEYETAEEFLEYMDAMMYYPEWRRGASNISREIAHSFDKSSFGDSMEKVYHELLCELDMAAAI